MTETNLPEGVEVLGILPEDMEPWPDLNPRTFFKPQAMAELEASVAAHGVQEPVLVSRPPEELRDDAGVDFWVVAGERRWSAALKVAPEEPVIAVVRELDLAQAIEIAVIENLEREDLTPVEEARGLSRWIETAELSTRDVANRTGRSQAWVANRLRLLNLPGKILDLIQEGAVTHTHARDLILPFERLELADVREELYSRTGDALHNLAHQDEGAEWPLEEDVVWKAVCRVARKLSRPVGAWGDNHGRIYVTEDVHEGCGCGGFSYAFGPYSQGSKSVRCFATEWWEERNAELEAEEEEREPAERIQLDRKDVVSISDFSQAFGYRERTRVTTENPPRLAALDPRRLPVESLWVVKPRDPTRWDPEKGERVPTGEEAPLEVWTTDTEAVEDAKRSFLELLSKERAAMGAKRVKEDEAAAQEEGFGLDAFVELYLHGRDLFLGGQEGHVYDVAEELGLELPDFGADDRPDYPSQDFYDQEFQAWVEDLGDDARRRLFAHVVIRLRRGELGPHDELERKAADSIRTFLMAEWRDRWPRVDEVLELEEDDAGGKTLPEAREEITALVETLLDEDEDRSVQELYDRVKVDFPKIRNLTLRQFNARFPLQVKRRRKGGS